MDLEQCVSMMEELSRVYKQIAITNKVPTNQINKLKHTLTELEIYMISIRKSVDQLKDKLKNKN